MIIGLTYDLKRDHVPMPGDPVDANAEFDHEETVDIITSAFESRGHNVIKIGNVHNLLGQLENLCVDIVFNISEGLEGRNREAQIPVILEMKRIPFVGSDGLTLSLTLDKVFTKKILLSEGIPTPKFVEVRDPHRIDIKDLNFPLIVKPGYEGSSKGINERSVVNDFDSLKLQVEWLISTYRQNALVEEFVKGQEFTVAILGNGDSIEPLPVVQIKIDNKLKLGNRFYTFSHITSNTLDYICPARITKHMESGILNAAVRTYRAVECRDFGRIDIRVDEEGCPYVLEINPLPSLSREDVFMVLANNLGVSYDEMLNRILNIGIERYGLNIKPKETYVMQGSGYI